RFVRDRIGGVNEQLDQEGEPELAPCAAQHGELGNESADTRCWRNRLFWRDNLGCVGHGLRVGQFCILPHVSTGGFVLSRFGRFGTNFNRVPLERSRTPFRALPMNSIYRLTKRWS